MRNVAKRIRVIYTPRNPLERLWSHTRFHLAFAGAFAQLSEWEEVDFRRFLDLPEINRHGRYAYVLATLAQNFDQGDYHVVIFEDIETSLGSLLARIEAFLGISPGIYNPLSLAEHHNVGAVKPMPKAFADAAKPMVDMELGALDARGFSIPLAWRM